MNIKRVFGTVLTILGIIGLVYAAVLFVNSTNGTKDIKALIMYSILGIIFFFAGMGLIRSVKDES